LLDAAGVHEHRLVTDDELYQVWFTARWLTLTENRNPDDPNELAYTLRKLRLAQTKAGPTHVKHPGSLSTILWSMRST